MTDSAHKMAKAHRNPVAAVPARIWIALVLVVLAVVFVLQNRKDVRMEVLFTSIISPLWVTLLGSVAVGIVIGVLASRRTR
jgi:uncharacterized integral membrane protein